VSLLSAILIPVFFSAIRLQSYPNADAYSPEVFRFWGEFFLILVGVSIVARIVIHIIFTILHTIVTRQQEPDITDERDRLIELRSTRSGLYVFGLGFLLAMGTLALDQPPTVMFLALLLTGMMSEIVSDASQFSAYRRGF
jgi:uncharacterized membrane protein